VPAAAKGRLRGDGNVEIEGVIAGLRGEAIFRSQTEGPPEEAGVRLAETLLGMGADRILSALREEAP
jgi:porphobilinogen deaminase